MTKKLKKAPRLVDQFVPSNYKLHIVLNRSKMTFTGTVVISGKKVGRPSQRIAFHQKDLRITHAEVVKHDKKLGDQPVKLTRTNTHSSSTEVRLHAEHLLYPAHYTISIDFSGTITEPMNGLYPCRFTHDGKEKFLLATQFESHHAREVFPCIDEPAAKATFDLSVTTESGDVVLSNMPEISRKKQKDLITVNFDTTPIMSTYLLAFVTGEMHSVETKSKTGVLFRSWASVAQPKEFLTYSANEGAKVIDFLTDYFGTPFPLPKCDQVALPDFDAGAMENWGLITYREIALLADPKNRSLSSEQYVSMVIAHELSHQWFGNLVTMKWWDDLWLNESFASLMEHVVLDGLHPDWNQWESYTASDVLHTSARDIYSDVQPVRAIVKHPDEISGLFDPAIVYAKGARLLKMMREFIGDDAFRTGLKYYFNQHAYQNTSRDDLWEAMHKSSKVNVKSLMDPWLEQSGMPEITVTATHDAYEITQSRFVLDATRDISFWPVPLLANQPTTPNLLKHQKTVVKTQGSEPLLINVHASGHYITHYLDDAAKNSLATSIANQSASAELRISSLNDMLLLSRAGKSSIIDALTVVEACEHEPRDAVWLMLARVIGQAVAFSEGDKQAEVSLYALRRKLAVGWYEKLGWTPKKGEDANTTLLRHSILGIMLAGRDEHAISTALDLYKKAGSCEALPSDIRGLVMTAVVRHGATNSIDQLVSEYQTTPNPEVQLAICAGLTEVQDAAVAKKLIKQALDKGGFVRTQDIFRWFVYFMRNPKTRDSIWDWLVKNWDRMEQDMGPKMLDDLPTYAAGALSTKQWQDKYHQFFDAKVANPLLTRNIKIAFAEIAARVAWRQREEPAIKSYASTLKINLN